MAPTKDTAPAAPTMPAAMIDAAVAVTMAQVVDDVEAGVVPVDVDCYVSLHDHVDANMYADDEVAPLWEADLLLIDTVGCVNVRAVQDRVDEWITSGGLRLEVSQRAWNRLSPEERTALEAEGLRAVPVPAVDGRHLVRFVVRGLTGPDSPRVVPASSAGHAALLRASLLNDPGVRDVEIQPAP